MDYPKARPDLPSDLVAPLTEALDRLGIASIATQLLETEFTAAEREQLGSDFPLRKLPEAYAALRQMSFERAVLDLAVAADVVTPSTRRLLLRRLGEEASNFSPESSMLPSFDLETGILKLANGASVNFKVRQRRTNRYRVLEAFQLAGWAKVIKNPLNAAEQETDIRQVVRELNQKVTAIRFFTQASGA
jgi:hypothetical protein